MDGMLCHVCIIQKLHPTTLNLLLVTQTQRRPVKMLSGQEFLGYVIRAYSESHFQNFKEKKTHYPLLVFPLLISYFIFLFAYVFVQNC